MEYVNNASDSVEIETSFELLLGENEHLEQMLTLIIVDYMNHE